MRAWLTIYSVICFFSDHSNWECLSLSADDHDTGENPQAQQEQQQEQEQEQQQEQEQEQEQEQLQEREREYKCTPSCDPHYSKRHKRYVGELMKETLYGCIPHVMLAN